MGASMFRFCPGHSIDYRMPLSGGMTGGQFERCAVGVQGDVIRLNMSGIGSGKVSGAHFHSKVEIYDDPIAWTLYVGESRPLTIPEEPRHADRPT